MQFPGCYECHVITKSQLIFIFRDLSKNSLSTIEVGAFSNLKRLKEL